MATAEQVYQFVVKYLREARRPSADAIVQKLGGSKPQALALRDEAYARIVAEGRSTDPLSELKLAAEPLLKKMLDIATRRLEREYGATIQTLRSQVQTLNVDVAKLLDVEERAQVAEEQLERLTGAYENLNQLFLKQSEALTMDAERVRKAELRAATAEDRLSRLTGGMTS